MGKIYDGIHHISSLIDAEGKIEYVFDDFKTGNYHGVVMNWLKENAWSRNAGWQRERLIWPTNARMQVG